MRKIRQVLNVYHAFKMYQEGGKRAGEAAKWKREHEDAWNIVSEVDKLRENYG